MTTPGQSDGRKQDQAPNREDDAQGASSAAGRNQRDGIGRSERRRRADAQTIKINPRLERTADHFEPKPIPRRIALQRPWPKISGSEFRLKYAISHLRDVAAAAGISIKVLPEGRGEAGSYDAESSVIHLAAECMKDPAL